MVRKQPGPPEKVSPRLQENLDYLQEKLGIGINIDILRKDLNLGGKAAAMLYVDGLTNGEVVVLLLQKLSTLTYAELCPDPWQKLMTQRIPHMEMESSDSLPQLIDEMLAGQLLLY